MKLSPLILFFGLITSFEVYISSSECKAQCLDKPTRRYCPTKDMKIGYCCLNIEDCPKEFPFCSSDLKSSPTLQQFICPFEPFCGTNTFNLTAREEVQTLRVTNATTAAAVFRN